MAGIDSALRTLTGEELAVLAGKLHHAAVSWHILAAISPGHAAPGRALDMAVECDELHADIIRQAARVTVPLAEAQAIIWRARFARGHPVAVSG